MFFFLESSVDSNNVDEIISLSTTTFDYENQSCLLADNKDLLDEENYDDNFEVGIDAEHIDLIQYWKNIKENNFSQKMNVLDISIKNTVLFITIFESNNKNPFFFEDLNETNNTQKQKHFLKANIVGSALEFFFLFKFKKFC